MSLQENEPSERDPIHLVDLAATHAEIADEVREGFERVVSTGAFIQGPEVLAFEKEYAAFSELEHCVAVSNGSDALELLLRAMGIGAGDEVIVPVNTFIATAASVHRSGAVPVFVDCDPEHLLIDPKLIEARLTPRTRAILPVHLYGQVAPMAPILELARDRDLVVFEDNAQSQGARQGGRCSGTFGHAAGTSFYPAKNLGAYGDAGAIVTGDGELATRLRALRNYGAEAKYVHPMVGYNCRLDSLQAVVLRAKLRHLARWNGERRAAAARYDELLAEVSGVRPVATRGDNEHVHHLYVVEVEGEPGARARIVESLQEQGIGAGIHYPDPLHLTGAFADRGSGPGSFPVAEAAGARVLSLPLYPQIRPDQQDRVVAALRRAIAVAPGA